MFKSAVRECAYLQDMPTSKASGFPTGEVKSLAEQGRKVLYAASMKKLVPISCFLYLQKVRLFVMDLDLHVRDRKYDIIVHFL